LSVNFRLNARLLPFLVGLLLLMQLLDPSRIWVTLLVGLGGAGLVGYLWARSLARHLRLRREMRFGWAQVGDRLEERFTIDNRSRLPALWVEVIDHSNLPGYSASLVTGVSGESENSWQTQGVCMRRGLFTLGPTAIQSGDPLGFFTVSVQDPASAQLMVMPPILPLPTIEVAPGGRAGEGRRCTNAPEPSVSVSHPRPYQPGDSPRWIHWRTSARRAAWYVRSFDSTPVSNWWIFLDMNRSVQFGQQPTSTEEHGIILAASLADRGLRLGRAVGLVAAGKDFSWLPPREGGERRWEILRALALIAPGSTSFADVLGRVRLSLEQRATLILITADTKGGWLASLLPLIWRGATATALLLDPPSFGGDGDSLSLASVLSKWGISHSIITPDLLNRPEATPGRSGQWEWRIMPTGQAVPIRRPRRVDWKALA
jgi:uncharacterized protein (DUF58 family)